jgi:hypothetical protein
MLLRASDQVLDAIRARDEAALHCCSMPIHRNVSAAAAGRPWCCTPAWGDTGPGAAGAHHTMRVKRPRGRLAALNEALDRDADLISRRSSDGWTPCIWPASSVAMRVPRILSTTGTTRRPVH